MSKEEFVKASYRQGSYFRKRAYTRDNPTLAQRKIRAQFAEIAHEEGTDQFGTIVVEGKEIPRSAKVIKDNMRSVTVPKPKLMPGYMFLDRELLERIIMEELEIRRVEASE